MSFYNKWKQFILNEQIKSNILLEFLTEISVEKAIKANPNLSKQIKTLSDSDPSGKNKYLEWAIKHINEADIEQIISAINTFHKFSKVPGALKNTDINFYKNFEQLQKAVAPLKQTGREIKNAEKENSVKLWPPAGVKSNLEMIRPLDIASSCAYGAGTRWCTAATKGGNQFRRYSSQGKVLYYIINKVLPQEDPNYKIAYVFKKENLRDEIKKSKFYKHLYGKPDEIRDALNDELTRLDVQKILGKKIEEQLVQIMIQDAKTGKETDLSKVEDHEIDRLFKSLEELKALEKGQLEGDFKVIEKQEDLLNDIDFGIEQFFMEPIKKADPLSKDKLSQIPQKVVEFVRLFLKTRLDSYHPDYGQSGFKYELKDFLKDYKIKL